MSKKKTVSGQTSKVTKASGGMQARSTSTARTTAAAAPTAFPLGFESLPGFAAFGVFCFLLFIAPYFFSGFWPASYEYWPHALFLALTACTCALYALEPNSQPPIPNSRIARLLVLFFAWCAISVGGTVYLHDSLLELARIGGTIACFFLARAVLASPDYSGSRAMALLLAIIAGGVLVCVPAILDFFATRNPRQFSTFYNPNLFANYCAMALPLAAGGVLLLRQRARENGASPQIALIGGCIVLAILVLGLFVTSSKGGFLAALCAGLVFIAAVLRAKSERVGRLLGAQKTPIIIAVLLVLIGGGVIFSQTVLPRLSNNSESHSTMFRVYTWAGTLEMANARPLQGWGAGSFPSAYTQFAQTGYTRSAHQSWLQVAAESGFPAMLFLLAVCVLAFVHGWKALQGNQWPVAAGSLGALTAFCIHGLTDSGWGLVSIGVLLMGVFALLEQSGSDALESKAPIKERQSSINWSFLLAALPLALGSWLYQRAQSGEESLTESDNLIKRGAVSTAMTPAQAAIASDPFSSRILYNYAYIREAAGQNPTQQYEAMIRLQPTRALNYLHYAKYLERKNGDKERIRQLFDKAVALDANDPEIRRTRGNWLLENDDANGWKDFEHIASLADKPYGKYPATPEMVDLNFARAYAKLATRDVERKQFTSAQKHIARGLEQIATARQYEPQRRQMEIEVHGAADEKRAQELDELEALLKNLHAKAPTKVKSP